MPGSALQGMEKDIIILATTITHGGAFASDVQRVNVALTRARHHLLVLGCSFVLHNCSAAFRMLLDGCPNTPASGGLPIRRPAHAAPPSPQRLALGSPCHAAGQSQASLGTTGLPVVEPSRLAEELGPCQGVSVESPAHLAEQPQPAPLAPPATGGLLVKSPVQLAEAPWDQKSPQRLPARSPSCAAEPSQPSPALQELPVRSPVDAGLLQDTPGLVDLNKHAPASLQYLL